MLSSTTDYHFITVILRFLNELKIPGEQWDYGTVTLGLCWKQFTYCVEQLLPACVPKALAPSPASVSTGWGWALGKLGTDPSQETKGYYEASMLRTLPCSAATCYAVGSVGFITVDCVNQNEHQQICRLLSWQLISTAPKRLSWRYICLSVHGCIADIRSLLILVRDDAVLPRNCCCSGLKCK